MIQGDGLTTTSSYLSNTSPGFTTDSFIYANAIVNSIQTGDKPAAIVFGNGNIYGSNQISLVIRGEKCLYANDDGVEISNLTATNYITVPELGTSTASITILPRTSNSSSAIEIYQNGTPAVRTSRLQYNGDADFRTITVSNIEGGSPLTINVGTDTVTVLSNMNMADGTILSATTIQCATLTTEPGVNSDLLASNIVASNLVQGSIVSATGSITADSLTATSGNFTGTLNAATIVNTELQQASTDIDTLQTKTNDISYASGTTTIAGTLSASIYANLPNFDASKITTGTLATARIPDLDASKITSGTLNTARIPDLDASKITTGTFNSARINSLGALSMDVGRGNVTFEDNDNDDTDGAGITIRTGNNPSNTGGSIFAVRSSGQASRLWVGQDVTSVGYNKFGAGIFASTGNEGTIGNYSFQVDNSTGHLNMTSGTISSNGLNITGSGTFSTGVIITSSTKVAIVNTAPSSQGAEAIAIGYLAGQNQGAEAIAIGSTAGRTSQALEAIAIGSGAGSSSQATEAIAIGTLAAQSGQGEESIAIGNLAGRSSQHANSIVLNSSGANLNTAAGGSCYIRSIRPVANSQYLKYNTSSWEVTYNSSSDRRMKRNIQLASTSAVDEISKLKVYTFEQKDYDIHPENAETVWTPSVGLISQEVYKNAPSMRHAIHIPKDVGDIDSFVPPEDPNDPTVDWSVWGTEVASLDYMELVPHAMKAIQELNKEIINLKTRITELENASASG